VYRVGVPGGWEPLVETTRGGRVESVHLGALAVVDVDGRVHWSIGDAQLVNFPRSSLKPLQLLALVARGGVERFGFTRSELAVMAASHVGEAMHIQAVSNVLAKIGAPPEALMCGAHMPINSAAAAELRTSGQPPTALHNNCSGKHAGMLALARLLHAPLADYIDPEHPAQRAIRATLIEVLELDQSNLTVGVDGCSAPAYAVPLDKMARGFALLGQPSAAPRQFQPALATIAGAMREHPELVAGSSGRIDTELMRMPSSPLVAKGGAEGYFCMGHADGLGFAIKIIDGDPAHRARSVAVAAAAEHLGWAAPGALAEFGPSLPITNWAERTTGEIRPTRLLLGK
jgi:L-asparaginase II